MHTHPCVCEAPKKVRAIAGALGLDIGWDGAASTVIPRSGGHLANEISSHFGDGFAYTETTTYKYRDTAG